MGNKAVTLLGVILTLLLALACMAFGAWLVIGAGGDMVRLLAGVVVAVLGLVRLVGWVRTVWRPW